MSPKEGGIILYHNKWKHFTGALISAALLLFLRWLIDLV